MTVRIGCVSYINSRPLVWGLDSDPAVKVLYRVPAMLLDTLLAGECDIALLPMADYQRADDLVVVPASCIGADGHVYTVRLYSRVPFAQIRRLYLDSESHTSVALCRIILKHRYNCVPEIVPDRKDAEAILLIGDKVVNDAPKDAEWELDLAHEWKNWQGLPFVFATWMCRASADIGDVAERLQRARVEGCRHIEEIVAADAPSRRWPAEVARYYLKHLLKFELDLSGQTPQRRAIELFHRLAHEMGLLERCRPLVAKSGGGV